MSAVIKFQDEAGPDVLAFAFAPAAARPVPASPAAPDPAEAERARLHAQIADLKRSLAETEAKAEKSVERALREGREAGLAEAEADEAERVAQLAEGVRDAVSAFSARLELIDGLAATLARVALAKVFEPADRLAELVAATLARQLHELRRSSVVAVRVSPRDFAGDEAVAALAAATCQGVADVQVDPMLPAGACRIECKLGQIDLDVRAQWDKIAALLEAMASEGEAP